MKKDTAQYNFDGGIYKPSEFGFFTLQYCNYNEIDFVLDNAVNENQLKGNNKKIYYYNIPCSFDIETTSFYRDKQTNEIYNYNQRKQFPKNADLEKISIMYVWQLGINGFCIIGRTWEQFNYVVSRVTERLKLNQNKRLLIYVHNLSFEFQFLRKHFQWQNVFSIELRKPLYALTTIGIEFRCSYLLSGYSLETVAKNLTKYKINKLVGDLDYHQIRHTKTVLTDTEIEYCINDIKIVMLYIKEYIENVKSLHFIPLTKTGAVRKFCRKNCFFIPKTDTEKTRPNYKYKDFIKGLQISDLNEFKTLQRAFSGGFTHANANYTDIVINNVTSFDFTSSYPYVMISEKYPVSKAVKINVTNEKQFEYLCKNFLCVFDVEFTNIFSRETFENYISVSKCFIKENIVENNGRLVCGKKIVLTITNIDYDIIKIFYKWENYRIGILYAYEKNYLPTEFIKCVVELYKKKTELKGVEGKENEYLGAKEMLNSCYGMSVTNPLRDLIEYKNNDWGEKNYTDCEKSEMLLKYNLSDNRFLYYIWGIFVTAYARRNLFTAIYELKQDYIYSDTDSVKFINYEKHKPYFDSYNKLVEIKLKNAADFHGLNYSDLKPKTIKGIEKLLGVWDFDGFYLQFKTLGAKRYMYQYDNKEFSLTVSGVNKKYAIPYLLKKYGENGIFKAFTNYLEIPADGTGKNIHTYIDYEISGKCTDLNGVESDFNELSGVHLEPTEYNLSLSVLYVKYLNGLKFTNKNI